ncbi:MAG: efflux RND transporter periplasmic adaptor subunit [Verrucomicrobiae bacterium]|nr:efflux RND transporter periplasmic adaptor subunit [Verrucomicrobiae bacterium]
MVRPIHQTAISSEIVTPVLKVGYREGQRFDAGAVLIEFDCRRPQHDLAALAAVVKEATVQVESQQHLGRGGAGNRTDLGVAEARHAKAVAEHASMRQRLEGCRLIAPYAGVVTELAVAAHETPQPNRPLLTIASATRLEIELIVPSRLLASVKPGQDLTFAVDETGRVYRSRVARSGGAVDPSSQTVKLFAEFVDAPDEIMPGMSGTARFLTTGG